MSDNSFEDIIDGQFAPNDWYKYGLNEKFTLLKPESALGELAIRLEHELDEASSEYHRYVDDLIGDDDPGWTIYEEEIDETLSMLMTAYSRRITLHSVYQRIWQAFDERLELYDTRAESKQTGKSPYEVAVDTAVKREVRERSSFNGKESLAITKLIREAGTLFMLEEDVHNIEMVMAAIQLQP